MKVVPGSTGRPDSPTGPHGPLFVPIVLTLERRDHEVLLREAASRNLVRAALLGLGSAYQSPSCRSWGFNQAKHASQVEHWVSDQP